MDPVDGLIYFYLFNFIYFGFICFVATISYLKLSNFIIFIL